MFFDETCFVNDYDIKINVEKTFRRRNTIRFQFVHRKVDKSIERTLLDFSSIKFRKNADH